MSLLYLGPRFRNVPFVTMLVLLAACFLGGGASRLDVMSLIYLQPLAVLCLALFLCTSEAIRWGAIKAPLILLGGLAAIMAAQLVPLPPDIWLALPGRAPFAAVDGAAGLQHPWRPISLTPDLTLASLISLSVPLAALVGFGALTVEQTRLLLPWLIGAAVVSALVGMFQLVGGGRSLLYFYDTTNFGSAVGLFANRNHQAVLLAMTWPMLALWASLPTRSGFANIKPWVALALGTFLLPMVMATGSRGGILLGCAGLVAGVALWRQQSKLRSRGRWNSLLQWVALLSALVVIIVALLVSRDEAVERLTGIEMADESRLQYLPLLLKITQEFFPVGTGFGSFDPIYRFYEPLEMLQPAYLNHAHNDLLEMVLVGGLPAAVLVIFFVGWLLRRAAPLFAGTKGRQSMAFAQLGATIVAMLLLSSLVDYPLRTPLMAALACIGCGWLADSRTTAERGVSVKRGGKELYDGNDRP